MQSSLPDIELWNAFVSGDEKAFSLLFRRFYPLLFQYGQKITTDTALLEDSIQTLFFELWQKPTAQPLLSVKAYLLKALKFKLFKSLRQKNRFALMDAEEGYGFELSAETMRINGEENEERTRKILQALAQLSPRQKEVIYLKIYKALSYDEVSEIMGLNYQGTRNLLYTAVKALKKLCVGNAVQLICLLSLFV